MSDAWRALLVLELPDGGEEMMHTDPPADYDDVARWLFLVASGQKVEGKRVKRALMVPVTTEVR